MTDAGGMLGLTWLAVKDGDERAFALFKRHYSYHEYTDGRRRLGSGYRNKFLIVGPGGKLVLLAPNCDALFVWRKFISRDGQTGINCAVFRNESNRLSSMLILDAKKLAWAKWPTETRLYTYVNPRAVKSSNPGFCFKRAGWRICGKTSKGLLILEKYRDDVTAVTGEQP